MNDSINVLVEKVKLKLNFVDYDGDVTIPDEVVKKHLETAKTIIDNVYTVNDTTNYMLYEECITEFTKYLVMISWIANAIDTERTPGTWATVLKNERFILKSLLLQLLHDDYIVNQLLCEEGNVQFDISLPVASNSHGLLTNRFI